MAGLYIHIPFCSQACHYCDFHFSTSRHNLDAMVNALGLELNLQKTYLDCEPIKTIYFGGGTPSLLSQDHLQHLIRSMQKNFTIQNAEVTLEANPEDLTEETLAALKQAGVNRLSIGIQSFDDSILKLLNRSHTAQDAMQCIDLARKIGFTNISIDLIFAIPGQDDGLLMKNIEKTIGISPEHISAYSLTIEEKTVFGQWLKRGKFSSTSDDSAAAQMEILMSRLGQAGYEQYEISNFSKPGFHSKHNSSYWQQQKYLGIGPSAHSYNLESRQHNISNNSLYIQSIERGQIPYQKELLTRENKINEYLFTHLRTSWGCDLEHLNSQFNFDLLKTNGEKIEQLINLEFVELSKNILLLTRKGKFIADKIAADLFTND